MYGFEPDWQTGGVRVLFRGERFDDGGYFSYAIGGKPAETRMFADQFLAWRQIDAVNLVPGDVAVNPLNVCAEFA